MDINAKKFLLVRPQSTPISDHIDHFQQDCSHAETTLWSKGVEVNVMLT